MNVHIPTKSAVSVSEMARMCGLSRARFYQLMDAGVFPHPVYNVHTRRPLSVEEMQKVCLEVRKRNCGINGQPILFYAPRHPLGSQPTPAKKRKAKPKQKCEHKDLIEALRGLGLESVSAAQGEVGRPKIVPRRSPKLGVGGGDQGCVPGAQAPGHDR